jgi:peptidylprolyl isomerase
MRNEEHVTGAQLSDTVWVHYTGTLDDGTVFDSSLERDPLEFTLGDRQVIPGFEQAVLGMTTGESKSVYIPAEEAYGSYRPEMVITVARAQFPPNLEPTLGQNLQIQHPQGRMIPVRVTGLDGDQVTLDGNHPLAGENLTFDIQLVDIG